MITVTEKKIGSESYYYKDISIDGKPVTNEIIHPRAVTVPHNGVNYYLLYSTSMEVQSDAFRFINYSLQERSGNTQVKANEALKFLLAFEEILGKTLPDFSLDDITSLKYFLHGYSPKGQVYSFDLTTVRRNDTVNGYLSVYRNYIRYLGIEKHPILVTSGKLSRPFSSANGSAMKSDTFRTSDRRPSEVVEVPKYISVDEFVRILELVREDYDKETEIIIRLMYQCGLRIGEVLGLTADDLVMEKATRLQKRDCYTYKDSYIPVAYLRNRVSDNHKYQHAKTCMKVQSKKQYKTAEYNTYFYGYQFVVVPQDLFDMINDYIEEAHVEARERAHDRYYAKTLADRVRESEEFEDDNYYVFINSIGTPLSGSSWNKRMREIFRSVGIPLDKNTRRDNLNHRFRHGYAMFNVQYCHTNSIKLADLLRHNNLESVMCYYNPTISEQIELKTKAIEDMYEAIPQLRRTT